MLKCMLFVCLFISGSAFAQVPEAAEDISPLLIGEVIPNVNVLDSNGNAVELNSVLKTKNTVLVFYRGGWCPYCNVQLSGLAAIEKEILALGYQIVAISPDDAANLKPTASADSVAYQLFADTGAHLIQSVGIGFKIAKKTKSYVEKKTKGAVTEVIPVPTVMVVNTKGEILFEYINPNYKTRLSSEMLLAVLKAL